MSRTRNPRATRAGFREAGEPWLTSKSCGQKPRAGQVWNISRTQDRDPRGRCRAAKVAWWLALRPGPFVYKAVRAQSAALGAQRLRVPKPEPSQVTSGLGVRLDPCNPLPAPPPRFRSLHDAPPPSAPVASNPRIKVLAGDGQDGEGAEDQGEASRRPECESCTSYYQVN